MGPRYVLIGLVVSFVATIALAGAIAADMTPPPPVATARFDGWGYVLHSEDGDSGAMRAHIEYDHASAADLRRFAATNRALARRLAATGQTTLPVTVSFRRPLSVEEFRAWATSSPARISSYQLRLVSPDGRRWTLGGAPVNGQLISVPDLQPTLDLLAAKGATKVQGVIAFDGEVDAVAYERLATQTDVFVADVTAAAVAAHLRMTAPSVDQARLVVLVAPAFAAMEDLGLANFR